jgi:GT2 family glycosyltransferase
MSIAAVVPVWNGRDLLAKLLDTLDAQTLRIDELLVVDNGSSDGAPELAHARGARVIPMGHNAGFAAAVNRGIRESRTDQVAVLNSDVELEPDYLAALAALVVRQTWFATGKILAARERPKRFIDGTYDALCRGGTSRRIGHARPDGPIFSTPQSIYSPPWTAVLFRTELFSHVGLLDERFESYLEDVDFGLRCAAHGLSGAYVPDAIAWHQGSASLGQWHPDTVRRITRNQIFLIARHYSRDMRMNCWWPILVAQVLWGAMAVSRGRGTAWIRGVREAFEALPEITDHKRRWSVPLQHLVQNERAIRDFQAATGFDTYWRLYFLLTGGAA